MTTTATVTVDVSQIPGFRKEALARGAIELVELVFSQPGAEERYQAWLAKRKGGESK